MDKLVFHKLIFTLAISFACNTSYAQNVNTNSKNQITEITFYSDSEKEPFKTVNSYWKGLVQVRFDDVIFEQSSSACNPKGFAVYNSDKAMISSILTAYTTQTPVKIYAEDTVKVSTANNMCFIRAVRF